jgi:hypothetical protein
MKKSIIIILLSYPIFIFSQINENKIKLFSKYKNDIRVDLFRAITSSRAEITYERKISKKYAVGLSGVFLVNQDYKKDYELSVLNQSINEFQINPFLRYYYAKSPSARVLFFAELFFSFQKGKVQYLERLDNLEYSYYQENEKNYICIGVGPTAGMKMTIIKRIVLDVHTGVAGNFIRTNDDNPDAIGRVGFGLGYKF